MTRTVLFLRNDPLATEALLAEAFGEFGYDVDTFDVVTSDRAHDPAGEVVFPDPPFCDAKARIRTQFPHRNSIPGWSATSAPKIWLTAPKSDFDCGAPR